MVQLRMETEIIKEIISMYPQVTTRELQKMYNDQALAPIKSYHQFLAAIADDPVIYKEIIMAKDARQRKMQIALQDAENALIENAATGDVKSIEFLLKTMSADYREKKQLDIQISHAYQEQLHQLDIAITSNSLPKILEAEIDES